jgi:hypothetical protein
MGIMSPFGLYKNVLQVDDEAMSFQMFTYHTSSATRTMRERRQEWQQQIRSCRVLVFG